MMSVCLLCGLSVSSCDVHEFPDPKPKEMEFTLKLNYDTNLPLYKVVEYEEETRSALVEEYNVRHIVKVFDAEAEGAEARMELYHFEFINDDISELNTAVKLSILPGNYNFAVWTDYVKADSWSTLQIVGCILIAINIGLLVLILIYRKNHLGNRGQKIEKE